MGNSIRIDTGAVSAAADNIGVLNDEINNAFADVENAVNRLDSEWDGAASEYFKSRFGEIRTESRENRYRAMRNYVIFLRNQIGNGYEATEETNTSLADYFK